MSIQTETKLVAKVVEKVFETENPMQERYVGQVAESVEVAAEAIFAARRLEFREDAGGASTPMFVP